LKDNGINELWPHSLILWIQLFATKEAKIPAKFKFFVLQWKKSEFIKEIHIGADHMRKDKLHH
jgi:hypothetical protein